MAKLAWEKVEGNRIAARAKVPGGLLVMVRASIGDDAAILIFVPDPGHEWN